MKLINWIIRFVKKILTKYDPIISKISDDNITRFNVDRSYDTLIDNYTNQGLTCK